MLGLVLALAGGAAAAWWLVLWRNRRRVAAVDHSGDPRRGIVIFVEPVRWLFVIWGFPHFCRGLRAAGCPHYIRLFRWSNRAGALFVLPDVMRRGRLQRKARRLAHLIHTLSRAHPEAPVHVVGYSSGAFVALEAVAALPREARVDRVVLLAATISPRYDLERLADRTRGVLHVHSRLDFAINGLGPLLFGCNDRRWSVSSGMVGLRRPAAFVEQHAWSASDAALGYYGDHFTVTAPRFVESRIAPLLS